MQAGSIDSPAVTAVPSGASVTYEQLENQSQRFVGALRLLNVQEGERIAFLLGNQIEYPIVLWGARRGGHDHLPLNTHATPDELRALILHFKPTVLVVSVDHAELAEKLALQHERDLTNLKRIVIGEPPSNEWYSFYRLLQRAPVPGKDALVPGKLLLLSGGSTGFPKIIDRPRSEMADTPRQSVVLAHIPHSSESVILISAPLYHTGPLGWLLGSLRVGAHVVVMERWNALGALEATQHFGVTIMPLVPTMMSRFLEIPLGVRETFDLSSLQVVSHSAAPCSIELKQRFMEWLPQLWSGYSMSEGFGLTVISPEEWRQHPGSVGRSVSWCNITIRNEQGDILPVGETGIVWFCRHDGLRMRYLGNTKETEASYNVQGEGTAFDLGYIDEEGYLYLTGRSKNMIIVGGVNIYPSTIENVLCNHPAVAQACVIGIPHEDLGETPCAVIEKTADHAALQAQDIQSYCHEQLGRLATPSKVVFVDSLPRTPTGKLRLGDVRALANS